jgi:mRNA interferase HigB
MVTIRLPAPCPEAQRVSRAWRRCGSPKLVPKTGAWYHLRMRIIARRTLREFVESRTGHRDQRALKAALDAWFAEVRKANWSNTADVKRLYSSASIVSSDRIVFNIRGNAYRLVVAADFEKGIVWIKWLGAHRDYDRIDVREVDRD